MRRVTVDFGNEKHQLDLTRSVGEQGTATRWQARCRLPFHGLMNMPVERMSGEVSRSKDDDKKKKKWARTEEIERDQNATLLEGIASSTSVDWHGTEMSLDALEMMMRQFQAGVPHVPSHRDDEWDMVFGRTVDAEIQKATIVNPATSDQPEQGHILRVATSLYLDDSRGKRLADMVDRGMTVGWSIGGWFTELEVITNDDDEIERMIIKGVELDHLATTRRPSNPDSWIGELSRSVGDAFAELRARKEDDEDEAEEEGSEDDESVGEEEEIGAADADADEDKPIEDEEEEASDAEEDEEESEDYEDDTTPSESDPDEDAEVEVGEDEGEDEEEDEDEDEKKRRSKSVDSLRHVLKIKETEDTIEVVYGKSKDFEGMYAMDGEEEIEDEVDAEEGDYEQYSKRMASGDTSLALADDGQMWEWDTDASNEVLGDEDWARYKKAHFWYDADAPDVKSSYKLPFAKMIDGELKAVWRGVAAAMAALNGARGGVLISDQEAQSVYKSISKYYDRFEKDIPDLDRESLRDCIENVEQRLDTREQTGEHSQQGNKAHRSSSAPVTETVSPKQEEGTMSEPTKNATNDPASSSDVAAQIADMRTLLESLAHRESKAMGTTPTTPEVSEADTLRARVAELETLVGKLAATPDRRGRTHLPNQRRMDLTEANSLVRAVQSELGPASALAAVAQEQAERRSATQDNLPSRGQLEADLRSILQAAMADGVITDPEARSAWR